MPYLIIRKPNGKVEVINKETGKVKAKNTTIKKAKKQVRLIGMKEKIRYL